VEDVEKLALAARMAMLFLITFVKVEILPSPLT
jgi:hypothetical protein